MNRILEMNNRPILFYTRNRTCKKRPLYGILCNALIDANASFICRKTTKP